MIIIWWVSMTCSRELQDEQPHQLLSLSLPLLPALPFLFWAFDQIFKKKCSISCTQLDSSKPAKLVLSAIVEVCRLLTYQLDHRSALFQCSLQFDHRVTTDQLCFSHKQPLPVCCEVQPLVKTGFLIEGCLLKKKSCFWKPVLMRPMRRHLLWKARILLSYTGIHPSALRLINIQKWSKW